jgi:tight adherence protein B
MRDIVIILWFVCVFMLITGILYYFLLLDKNFEKRLNYYLDIEKKYKSFKYKKAKSNKDSGPLKRGNEYIRKKMHGELSYEKQRTINQMLMSAGVSLSPEEYIMLRLFLVVVVGGVLYLIFNNVIMLIGGAIGGYLFPKLWIDSKRKKRMFKFNKALPDMINTIIGALRAGYSFTQAMKTVSEDCESPIKDEVMILLKELNFGITMEEALNNLNIRMPSVDLELMIEATLIQRQVGGNLSSILEIIVNTIRERNKLNRQVRTLTAQGRLSGKIIGALPIVLGFILYLFDPTYMNNFLDNILGKIAVCIGVLAGIIGFIIINRITKIEV